MTEVKITDSDEFLEIYNYNECCNENEECLKKKRGAIYEKDTDNIIAYSFGYTDLYTEEDDIQTIFENLQDWKFYYSLEVTLLRLFMYNNKWYLVTHKKLDAFKSRWSCRETFGELFVSSLNKIFDVPTNQVFDWLTNQLNPQQIYFFLLKSNYENRIVCQYNHKQDKIIFLGTLLKGEGNEKFNFCTFETEPLLKIKGPENIEINNYDELKNIVHNINPFQYQGIIAIQKTSGKQIKILNNEYHKFYQLRGNNPNLRFRYLELRNDEQKLKDLYNLYPKYAETFDHYEDILYKISRMIYHFYVNRYIKNQFITLPKEEFLVMKKCHNWYLLDRKENRIFTKKIMEFLNEEPALNLYKMIRRYTLNQTLALKQNLTNFEASN